MSTDRFCEGCGAPLAAGLRFCEACGQPVAGPLRATTELAAPAEATGVTGDAAAPVATRAKAWRRPATMGLVALAITLLIAVALWRAYDARQPDRPAMPVPAEVSTQAEEPPRSGTGNRPEATSAEATARMSDDELSSLKEAVVAANRAQTEAVLTGSPDTSRLSDELLKSIERLGRGVHRYDVVDRRGSLAQARREMELFLRGVTWKGLGLSNDTIAFGVSRVLP